MKLTNSPLRERALFVASVYYLIIATIIFIPNFYFLFVHIFSSEPAYDYNEYAFQIVWLSFFLIVILINSQIIFIEKKRFSLAVNIFFSAIQIISFQFSHLLYLLASILASYSDMQKVQLFKSYTTHLAQKDT